MKGLLRITQARLKVCDVVFLVIHDFLLPLRSNCRPIARFPQRSCLLSISVTIMSHSELCRGVRSFIMRGAKSTFSDAQPF